MGRAFGWSVALVLALGAAGGAGAATLSPVLAPQLSTGAVPSVSAPPPAAFQLSVSDASSIWDQPPKPAALMLVATGLAGLVVLSHNEFA